MNKITFALFGLLLMFFSLCYSSHSYSIEKLLAAQQLLSIKITSSKELDVLWEAAITEQKTEYVAKIVSTYMLVAADPQININDIWVVATSFGNEQIIKMNSEELNRVFTKYREIGLQEEFKIATSALWSLGSNAQSSLFYPLNEIVVSTVYSQISKSDNKQINDTLLRIINVKNLALYGSRTGQCG